MPIQGSFNQATGGFLCGTLALADTNAHPLVSLPTRCSRVMLIAPRTGGVASNAGDVHFGDANKQNDYITKDGSRDRLVHVDDASKIMVKSDNAGDKLEYRIEF